MKVGVLGAGAYGLALTHILVNNKVEVTMWTHDENERKTLDETRKSKKLNDYKIPNEIKFTCDLNEAVNIVIKAKLNIIIPGVKFSILYTSLGILNC